MSSALRSSQHMSNRHRPFHLFLGLVFLFSFSSACTSPKAAPAPTETPVVASGDAEHVMRTYQVPPGHQKSVARLLEATSYPVSATSANGTQTMFVRLHPQFTSDGYFVLSAPKGLHAGVEELLSVVAKAKPIAGPPAVRVSYWLVLGYPADDLEIDPKLVGITKALEPLTELGVKRFELLEGLSLMALDGEEGVVRGRLTTVKHTASTDAGSIELRLSIHAIGGGKNNSFVETAVNLKPGQFAVLGQAGYTAEASGLNKVGEAEPTLFYLAKAETVD